MGSIYAKITTHKKETLKAHRMASSIIVSSHIKNVSNACVQSDLFFMLLLRMDRRRTVADGDPDLQSGMIWMSLFIYVWHGTNWCCNAHDAIAKCTVTTSRERQRDTNREWERERKPRRGLTEKRQNKTSERKEDAMKQKGERERETKMHRYFNQLCT